MSQQISPWVEGAYGWSFGEDGWNSGMDSNLLKFSYLFDKNVDSVVSSLPPAVSGKAYYLTTDNRIYFAVNNAYLSTPVPTWFIFNIKGSGQQYQYNGTTTTIVPSLDTITADLDAVETTVDSLGTAAFEDIGFFVTPAQLDVSESNQAAYTDSAKYTRTVLNVSALRSGAPGRYDGDKALLAGYYTTGSGGGLLYWDSASTAADNGVTVFAVTGVTTGRWKRPDEPITAQQAGCIPDFNGTTGTDNRVLLQRAVDNTTHLIIDGSYGISLDNTDVGRGISLKSNFTLHFNKNAKISNLAHNATIYQMLRAWGCDNLTLSGDVYLDGRKAANSAVTGEFGMGLDVRGGSNLQVKDKITTVDCWGDGIYIGLTTTTNLTLENSVINNHTAIGCRRQGMSIISAKSLVVNNPYWKNIAGTPPQAGLDIEPNSNNSVLSGIVINKPRTEGCVGGGVVIELSLFGGATAKTVDIQINDHRDDGSANGAIVNGLDLSAGYFADGKIEFKSPTWVGSLNQAFVSSEYDANGPEIKILKPTVIDCNRNAQVSLRYGSAFVVLRDTGSLRTYKIGNVMIEQATIIRRSGTILKPYYFDETLQDNTFCTKCYFVDPLQLTGLADNSGGFFGQGFTSDKFGLWVQKLTGSTNITSNTVAPLEFADVASTITMTAGQFILGAPDIIVRKPNNTNTHTLIGPAAGCFLGLAGTIQRLSTTTQYSYLRVRPVGSDKFIIIERVGLWTESA